MLRRAVKMRGFTLIELLVVIAIIGVLAAILLPTVTAARCRSKEGAAQATIRDLESAIKAYESDYAQFPPDDAAASYFNWPLVWCLARPGSRGTPYYAFRRQAQAMATGAAPGTYADQLFALAGPPTVGTVPCFYSPITGVPVDPAMVNVNMFFYDRNVGDGAGTKAFNPFSFDLWTGSCVRLATTGTDATDWGGNSDPGRDNSQITNWR